MRSNAHRKLRESDSPASEPAAAAETTRCKTSRRQREDQTAPRGGGRILQTNGSTKPRDDGSEDSLDEMESPWPVGHGDKPRLNEMLLQTAAQSYCCYHRPLPQTELCQDVMKGCSDEQLDTEITQETLDKKEITKPQHVELYAKKEIIEYVLIILSKM